MSLINSWKVNWVLRQFASAEARGKNTSELVSITKYWWMLLTKLLNFNHKTLLELKNGGKIYIDDLMSLYIYNEIFIEKEYDFGGQLESDGCVIDIGANTGIFMTWIKLQYPEAVVYCFEPFKRNYDKLIENIDVNGFKNVRPINKGIGSPAREEKLFIHPTNLGAHSIIREHAHFDEFTLIDLISLDDALALTGKQCSLLKLDCEGAEYEILKNLTNEQAQRIDRIVFEPSSHLYEVEELDNLLRSFGYDVGRFGGNHFAIRPGA